MRISLLGGFRVVNDGTVIPDAAWGLRKAKAAIKLQALAPGHWIPRDHLARLLWPEHEEDPAAARNNLYRTLCAARRTLCACDPGRASAYLRIRDRRVILCPPAHVRVDIDAFIGAYEQALRAGTPKAYADALALYTGDLLPEDPEESWAREPRERLRERYALLLYKTARLQEERGATDDAIALYERAAATLSAMEAAQVALMRLHSGEGRRYLAMRQYQQLRDALRREHDAQPGPETERLYADIRRGAGAPAAPSPAGARAGTGRAPDPPGPRPGAFVGAFIGRAREIAEVTGLLGQARLVTLTGAGGCGKSRLAEEVAGRAAGAHADGVVIVEMAAIADGQFVPRAVLAALGVREEPGRSPRDALLAALAPKDMLLVLDNCERLLAPCAELAGALLRGCPSLRLLATSRQPLGVDGERAWCVPSLGTPDPERLPPYEELLEYDAIRLFCDRAAESTREFALTPATAPEIIRICARLDGIPLAIELAARRRRWLDEREIARRLDECFGLLSGGGEEAPARHRTLRATIDWSHDLLGARARMLFRRLSVFSGGWTVDAAERICAGAGLAREEILDLLIHLVEKSLVVDDDRAGPMRFRLLEPIRQYAAAKLAASGEAPRLRRRHAVWCLGFAETAEPRLTAADQKAWLDQLQAELGNLRAALRWVIASRRAAHALRLSGALMRFWVNRALVTEGRDWLAAALALPESRGTPARVRAKALGSAGWLAAVQGEMDAAVRCAEESLALYRALGMPKGALRALATLGADAEERGDMERATRHHEESLELARSLRDGRGIAIALSNLADIEWKLGAFAPAAERYEEALARFREVEDRRSVAMTLVNLGRLMRLRETPDRALPLLAESEARFRALGDARGIGDALCVRADVARDLGDLPGAMARYGEALTLHRRVLFRPGIITCLEGVARVAQVWGQAARATLLAGAADELRRATGATMPPKGRVKYAMYLADLRAALGEERFAQMWHRGQAAALDDAFHELRAIVDSIGRSVAGGDGRGVGAAPARPQRRNAWPLSDGQREVARLILKGGTRPEIASALAISERTVATHLRRIRAKLDIPPRAPIRAWLAAHPEDEEDEDAAAVARARAPRDAR